MECVHRMRLVSNNIGYEEWGELHEELEDLLDEVDDRLDELS